MGRSAYYCCLGRRLFPSTGQRRYLGNSLLVEHGGDRVHAQAGAKMLYFRRQTKAAEKKGNVEG